MTAKEQNKLAGIFLMAHGAIQAFVMFIVVLVYGGFGTAILSTSSRDDEQFAGIAIIGFALVMAFFAFLFVVPQLIGGWKMIKERPNARVWGIVGSIISCLSFPLGTAAGVFGLVFLFGETGRQFYLAGTPAQPGYFPPQPPAPNSWQ